jgi:hypothetical protein
VPRAVGGKRDDMTHQHTDRDRGRTPAEWYCLVAGGLLLLVGILGFIADASFDTGNGVDGGLFLGFEVNATHNLVHVASGLVLLIAARRRDTARAVAIAFGVTYGLVAIIGLIDGEDVLTLLPVNGADNVLHVLLSALGIVAGIISRPRATDRATSDRFDREGARTSEGVRG